MDCRHREYEIASHQLRILNSGDDFFSALIELIEQSLREIHLQTYIFNWDTTGQRIWEALLRAAERGVNVHILLDDFGSASFRDVIAGKILPDRIRLRFFGSYRHWNHLYWGRRLHHKVVIADDSRALIGGINIADHYSGWGGETAWLDFGISITGDGCIEMAAICRRLWGNRRAAHRRSSPHLPAAISILQHDYFRRKRQIQKSYLQSIRKAEKEITLFASYFMPGRSMRMALARASKRGVKVKLVLQGISDVPFVKAATQYLYGYCQQHHMEIYEWERSVLHAKAAVVDGTWLTIGSYNLNHLSAYASIEMNLAVREASCAAAFSDCLHDLIGDGARRIPVGEHTTRGWLRIRLFLSYHLLRWSFRLMYLALLTHKKWMKTGK